MDNKLQNKNDQSLILKIKEEINKTEKENGKAFTTSEVLDFLKDSKNIKNSADLPKILIEIFGPEFYKYFYNFLNIKGGDEYNMNFILKNEKGEYKEISSFLETHSLIEHIKDEIRDKGSENISLLESSKNSNKNNLYKIIFLSLFVGGLIGGIIGDSFIMNKNSNPDGNKIEKNIKTKKGKEKDKSQKKKEAGVIKISGNNKPEEVKLETAENNLALIANKIIKKLKDNKNNKDVKILNKGNYLEIKYKLNNLYSKTNENKLEKDTYTKDDLKIFINKNSKSIYEKIKKINLEKIEEKIKNKDISRYGDYLEILQTLFPGKSINESLKRHYEFIVAINEIYGLSLQFGLPGPFFVKSLIKNKQTINKK